LIRAIPVTLAAVLLAGGAVCPAADYHVLRDVDGDGNANGCPNTAHRTHYASDTVPCGGTFDIDGDGTAETLYCDLQAAANAATSPGDTVEIHQGNYGPADSSFRSVDFVCQAGNAGVRDRVMLVIPDCPSCTGPSSRRYFRAAEMLGSTDTGVSLDPKGCGNCTGAVVIGDRALANVRYVTLRGLTIEDSIYDKASCDQGENGRYTAPIMIKGHADWLVVEDNNVDLESWNSAAECTFSNGSGMVFFSQVNGATGGDVSDVLIRNNTVRACNIMAVKCGSCSYQTNGYKRWEIAGNDFTAFNDTPSGDSENLFEFKGLEHVAFHGNTIDCRQPDQWGKARYSDGKWFFFNNVFNNCELLIHHQGAGSPASFDGADIDFYVFNNTVRNAAGKGGEAIVDGSPTPPGDTVQRMVNNSWERRQNSSVSTKRPLVVGGYEHWDLRSYGSTPQNDLGNYVCSDDAACGQNTALGQCGGSGGCDATVHGTGGFPFKLQQGSSLIDAGTNNPLGQGPNQCTISASNGLVDFPSGPIACYYDREGDDRRNMGSSWDIGADEYDQGPPAVCGDGIKGGIEECDGSDFGTDTCVDYGFTGGTLACTGGCTADTSGCVSIPPGDVTNTRRTDVR
jgi:hypothetical protein